MIANPASLRSDFIHIAGTGIHIALESTIHITGIGTKVYVDRMRAIYDEQRILVNEAHSGKHVFRSEKRGVRWMYRLVADVIKP